MSVQMFAVIIFTALLFVAVVGFTYIDLKSKEILRGNKHTAYVVKITKVSGRVTYGVKFRNAGPHWMIGHNEFDTPEEAQKRADRLNDKKTIKVERYKK